MAATGSVAVVTNNPSATVNVAAKEISADDFAINATAAGSPNISVKGYSVGAIAAGSNLIQSTRDLKADASLSADNATLNNLNINAQTNSAPNLNVKGDGGGLAGIDTLKQSDSVKLGGTFDIKDSVKVNAQSGDAGSYLADALGAAITLDNANIKTAGSQNYTAANDLGYNLDLKAAGYGGLNASAGSLKNTTNYTSAINVNKSNLTSDAINFSTKTTGNATSLNNLKAARQVSDLPTPITRSTAQIQSNSTVPILAATTSQSAAARMCKAFRAN